eukprot:3098191-Prymnesium_polylepis.1
MYTFEHKSWGRKLVRQFGPYSLPAEVEVAADFVTGISDFPMPRAKASKLGKAAGAASPAEQSSKRRLQGSMQGM